MKFRPRKLLKFTAIGLLVLAALLVGAYLLRDQVLARPLALVLEGELSKALGGRFTIERVEGNLHSQLVIIGMRTVEEPSEGALRRLEFERATVRYDFRKLMAGDFVGAIESVSVRGARIELDGDAEPAAPDEPEEPWSGLPARLPKVDVEGSILVRGKPLSADRFKIAGDGSAYSLRLEGLRLPLGEPTKEFSATLRRTGPDVLVVESKDRVAGVAPEQLTLTLPRAGGAWSVAGRVALEAGSIDLRLGPDELEADTRRLDLSRLPRWINDVSPLPQAGVAGLKVARKGTGPYSVNARIEGLQWEDWHANIVEVRGEWGVGGGRIERVRIDSTRGQVEIDDVSVDLSRPYRVGTLQRIHVAIPDLRLFLDKLPTGVADALPEGPVAINIDAHRTEGEQIAVEGVEVTHGKSRLFVSGTARLPAAPEAWRDTAVDLKLEGQLDQPHALAVGAGLPVIDGVVTVDGTAKGGLEAPTVELKLAARELTVAERAVREFTLAGQLIWPTLTVSEFVLLSAPGTVRGHGVVDLATGHASQASLELDIRDLAGLAAMVPGAPAMAGSLSGSVNGLDAGGDGWAGRLDLKGKGIVVDDFAIGRAEIVAQARNRKLTLERLEVEGANGKASVVGSCLFGRDGGVLATLDTLVVVRDGIKLTSLDPLVITAGGGAVGTKALNVRVLGGTVRGRARLGEKALDVDVTGTGLRVEQLLPDWSGAATVTAKVSGTRAAPVFDVHVDAPELEFTHEAVRGKVLIDARQNDRGIELRALDVLAEGVRVEGSGALPLIVGDTGVTRVVGHTPKLTLTVRMDRWPESRLGFLPVRCETLTADIDADADHLKASVDVTGLDHVADEAGILKPSGTANLEVEVSPDAASFTLNGGGEGPMRFDGSGRLGAGGDWLAPRALWKSAGDALLSGSLGATIPDLALLRPLLPELKRIAGSGRIDVTVGGTARKPEVHGELVLDARDLLLEGGPPAIQELNAHIRLDPARIDVIACTGQMGYAPFRIGGWCELSEPSPTFEVRLFGENLLVVADPQLRVRTDAAILWSGTTKDSLVAGELKITDARYTQRVDVVSITTDLITGEGKPETDEISVLFSLPGEFWRGVRLDLDVTASQSIAIHNNILRGRASADLHLGGSGEVPVPVGTIHVRRPQVGLAFGQVQADHALVIFTEIDPFQPVFRVFGNIRPFLTTRLLSDDPDEEGLFDRIQVEIDTETIRTQDELRLNQIGLNAELKLSERWNLFAENSRRNEYGAGILWRVRFR